MVKAVIFDMDGLLVNTEPFWRKAEMKVFKEVGIALTEEMTNSTTGLKINEVVDHWYQLYPWDENKIPRQKIIEDVLDELEKLIMKKGKKMAGADYIIDFFAKTSLKKALASSSPIRFIKFILKRFNLLNIFDVIHSGEFEECGKPDPSIYLTTSNKLNVYPYECIAFEDSYYGLLSAKRAGMKVVTVPDKFAWNDKRFDITDLKLRSLNEFYSYHFEMLNEKR